MAENGTKRKLSDSENGGVIKKVKAVKEAGTLLFSGLTDYKYRNAKETFAKTDVVKWSPIRFKSLEDVRIRDVSSGALAYFTLAISDDGSVYAWGLNKFGQLGMGDNKNRLNPTLMESMSGHNVVAVATGRQHCLMLTDVGDVYACGDNRCGQCGIGQKKQTTATPIKIEVGTSIKSVVCGDEFSLILSESGQVFSFGSPENGQLGQGSENKEIRGKKEIFHYQYTPALISSFIEVDEGEVISHGDPTITYIDCGPNHCCAIDDQQRLFTWGFGGYGRLGHNCTRNEMRPRLMKCWFRITGRADGGVTRVWCGGQFNLVDTIVDKCKYMFGQFHRASEANMYPKFMEDFQGWNVRHVVCSQFGYTVCADDCVIGSAPSPGFGTLGMGVNKKSSASPMILTCLKDVHCLRSSLGYMHACFIVRDESDKDTEAIEKFPFQEFEEPVEADDDDDDDETETKGKKGKSKPKAKPIKKKK